MKAVLTEHLDDEAAAWLAERTRLVRVAVDDRPALARELADADALVIRTYTIVDETLLAEAPSLRVVGRAGVGLDNVDLAACRRRGVRVVYTPDANTEAVVEYVFALLLDHFRPRRALETRASAAEFHRRRSEDVGRGLTGLTLGIVGMGRIGRRVARVAHGLAMNVLATDVLSPEELALPADQPGELVPASRLWSESDVITLHADGRRENRGLVGAEVLGRLKPSCVLVNTARGMLVDAAALSEWARRVAAGGGAAILDVHEPEPPPEDYPLWAIPNVRLLPHLASRTERALRNMSWVVRDVVRVLEGGDPEHAAT
jgi:phosphoglycerate dehydrogenase-like enzyme